jgi:hypothetical protein
MIMILVDHDMEGQAFLLWGTLSATGWLELLPMRLVRLTDVGLPDDSIDRKVWPQRVPWEVLEPLVLSQLPHVTKTLLLPCSTIYDTI